MEWKFNERKIKERNIRIKKRKINRSENVEKIYKIVMLVKFHVYKEKVHGMTLILVKSLMTS